MFASAHVVYARTVGLQSLQGTHFCRALLLARGRRHSQSGSMQRMYRSAAKSATTTCHAGVARLPSATCSHTSYFHERKCVMHAHAKYEVVCLHSFLYESSHLLLIVVSTFDATVRQRLCVRLHAELGRDGPAEAQRESTAARPRPDGPARCARAQWRRRHKIQFKVIGSVMGTVPDVEEGSKRHSNAVATHMQLRLRPRLGRPELRERQASGRPRARQSRAPCRRKRALRGAPRLRAAAPRALLCYPVALRRIGLTGL